MQNAREFTAKQVADMLNVNRGTVTRWHSDGKLKGEVRGRELYIKEYYLRDFLFRRRDRAEVFLQLFETFKEYRAKIAPLAKKFFGDSPGCVMALPPGGIPYALCLYFSLSPQKNINFVSLSEKQLYEPSVIAGRKILLVDDSTRTGETLKTVKETLESVKELNIKEVKIAVYDDFLGCADFAVERQPYEEHLRSLSQALKQFRF